MSLFFSLSALLIAVSTLSLFDIWLLNVSVGVGYSSYKPCRLFLRNNVRSMMLSSWLNDWLIHWLGCDLAWVKWFVLVARNASCTVHPVCKRLVRLGVSKRKPEVKVRMSNYQKNFVTHQRSRGKVMFSQVYVCLSTVGPHVTITHDALNLTENPSPQT